ncbi:topology modulation protein [Planococcus sp. YIM B11945]|uniref:topology modulation protein n=1 Tax=Planococcus sp. YIM B11945 TaxID=3435410 RepID=UPI003D7EACB0
MEKVMVIGVSAGVGKSTFAKILGKELGLPVFHLDSYHWKPGWVEAKPKEFENAQRAIVKKDKWIIEGNYSETFHLRMAEADTIIYLELPLSVCLYRVLKRWLANRGKTRPDMGAGCPEKMDLDFLKFIVFTYSSRKVKMKRRLQEFRQQKTGNVAIALLNQKQIDGFMKNGRRSLH